MLRILMKKEQILLTFYEASALKNLENSDEDEGTDHASFVEAQVDSSNLALGGYKFNIYYFFKRHKLKGVTKIGYKYPPQHK